MMFSCMRIIAKPFCPLGNQCEHHLIDEKCGKRSCQLSDCKLFVTVAQLWFMRVVICSIFNVILAKLLLFDTESWQDFFFLSDQICQPLHNYIMRCCP